MHVKCKNLTKIDLLLPLLNLPGGKHFYIFIFYVHMNLIDFLIPTKLHYVVFINYVV